MSLPRIINIVVTGAARSGKRTFINSIREREAYDGGLVPASSYFGRVRLLPEITLFLFPAPASRPLKVLNAILDQSFFGAVVLVDSAHPDQFRETRAAINTIVSQNIPLIVAANKQDRPDAWSLTDLRIALHLGDTMPLLACQATERDSVKAVLEGLFAQILLNLETQPPDPSPTAPFVPPEPPTPPTEPRPPIKPLKHTAALGKS
ncbi:MAG: ADP-ribosylation factor-like protein [Candidatus Flexifilum sp.]|jgi:signal recognition particle receptor subunit beta